MHQNTGKYMDVFFVFEVFWKLHEIAWSLASGDAKLLISLTNRIGAVTGTIHSLVLKKNDINSQQRKHKKARIMISIIRMTM